MTEGLNELEDIGAQKIHEKTHIPIEHIQAILHNSFDGFTKVQFVGFINILEREYNRDLSVLKRVGLAYLDDKDSEKSLVISPSQNKSKTMFYISFLIIAVAVTYMYRCSLFESESCKNEYEIDNRVIEKVKREIKEEVKPEKIEDKIDLNVIEKNVTITSEKNETNLLLETTDSLEINRTIEDIKPEVIIDKSLKILANKKVWLGYIDIDSYKKYQKTFSGEFDLDPEKNWLLVFGHSRIEILVNSNLEEFNSTSSKRFLYKNGLISNVSLEEFKRFNRGNRW